MEIVLQVRLRYTYKYLHMEIVLQDRLRDKKDMSM